MSVGVASATTRGSLVDLLAEAGLTGRGGAAFSTAVKLEAAQRHGADLIVNACDGEPGTVKDAWVVARHLPELLEGARLAAGRRTGRTRFAAHRGSATAGRLRAAGLDVLEVPAHYVSSEETSLISASRGGSARPLTRRAPFVTGGTDSRGRRVRPTLVLNAETTWRIAQVVEHGIDWFRSYGTPAEPGPRLVSIHGHVAQPGVLETSAGVPLARLLAATGHVGPVDPDDLARAGVLVGGLAGVFLTGTEAAAATWSAEGLAPYGGSLGSGVIEVLDPGTCPLSTLVALVQRAAGESAGQCGPCMFGLPSLAVDLAALVARPDPAAQQRVHGRLGLLPGRGACHHPDGTARLAASGLRAYAAHLELHAQGPCGLRPAPGGRP